MLVLALALWTDVATALDVKINIKVDVFGVLVAPKADCASGAVVLGLHRVLKYRVCFAV